MTKRLELYKCNVCGNIIQVFVSGNGELVCCGEKMELLAEQNNKNDIMLSEKHSPQIELKNGITKISVPNHPMQAEHYIMFLQGHKNNEIYTKFLETDNIAEMNIANSCDEAVSYCNIHGLYRGVKG